MSQSDFPATGLSSSTPAPVNVTPLPQYTPGPRVKDSAKVQHRYSLLNNLEFEAGWYARGMDMEYKFTYSDDWKRGWKTYRKHGGDIEAAQREYDSQNPKT